MTLHYKTHMTWHEYIPSLPFHAFPSISFHSILFLSSKSITYIALHYITLHYITWIQTLHNAQTAHTHTFTRKTKPFFKHKSETQTQKKIYVHSYFDINMPYPFIFRLYCLSWKFTFVHAWLTGGSRYNLIPGEPVFACMTWIKPLTSQTKANSEISKSLLCV